LADGGLEIPPKMDWEVEAIGDDEGDRISGIEEHVVS
jgi:hypothetical protein